MNIWLIITLCLVVVISLHCLAELRNLAVIAVVNVLLHIGVIIMLLLLAAELREVFVFLLVSVTADLVIRLIARHISEKKAKENAAKASAAAAGTSAVTTNVSAAADGAPDSGSRADAPVADEGAADAHDKEDKGKEGVQ